jgi:phospholysine phosphohistidine inorganic pyrophosphate phosphatase
MSVATSSFGVLLDIDGVLYVGDEPIAGAHEALSELRSQSEALRLVTNTTSRSRREVAEHLDALGFEVALEEILTPAAMAVRHCEECGHSSVELFVSDGLREDLAALGSAPASERSGGSPDSPVDAVILGDVGARFDSQLLNHAFRLVMEGAELIALQHNRYWRRADGLALDVGAYSAALEYATRREAVVVGKPAQEFFAAALAELEIEQAVMIGDDVEADVEGAMAAGMAGVLVRTGKFRQDALPPEVTPTVIADSIADVPELLTRIFASRP